MLEWISKNIIDKIDLPILIIFFLILCYFLSDNREGFKEGIDIGGWFRDVGNKIKSGFEKLMDEIKDAMGEFVEKLKQISPERIAQELRKPFDSAGDLFKKGMNDAKRGFNKLGDGVDGPIGDMIRKIKRLLLGYIEIIEGVGIFYFGSSLGTWLGFVSDTVLIEYSSEYFITNFMCFLKFLVALPFCAFFYLMDIAGNILYFPIRMLLAFIYVAIYRNIYYWEDYVWKQIGAFDNLFCKMSGFYLTHWPKTIRDQCYNCKRLKHSVLREKAEEIGTYNNDFVYPLSTGGLKHIIHGVDDMFSVISDLLHGR